MGIFPAQDFTHTNNQRNRHLEEKYHELNLSSIGNIGFILNPIDIGTFSIQMN